MEHTPAEDRLVMARRHVREAEARVQKQRAMVAELARDGHSTAEAEDLLETMLKTLSLMREELVELESRR